MGRFKPLSTAPVPERAILVGVDLGRGDWPIEESLAELARLAETDGAEVVHTMVQRLDAPVPRTFIGSGKAQELVRLVGALDADVVIFDDELTPSQQSNLERIVGEPTKVIDRTALILDIFGEHARTHEGRLQVQLAQLQYVLPRLRGMWSHLVGEQTRGGIGGREMNFGKAKFKNQTDEKKKSVISKLIAGTKHLNAAFICQNDTERSAWTRGHAEGAAYLAEALGDSVSVKTYFHADTPEDAERLIGEAVSDGADLVFTTTPQLLDATLKAAVKHPKVGFYNCSACQPFSSVKSYYCRIYEGKFITGLIAGALADNDLVGYVGSYPIMGVPASINAFALGARMTNPRAKILLEWSATEIDCVRKFRERGVRVISNRDIPTADASGLNQSYIGTFTIDGDGGLTPIASPVWMWGKLYEHIVRSVLSGSVEKKEHAVNYWWGMDSGAIDIALSDLVPEGVRKLAETMTDKLKRGELDVFAQRITAQDGSVISDGVHPLSSLNVLRMDRLSDAVEGHIPEYGELLPFSRALVRALGVYRDRIPPEAER